MYLERNDKSTIFLFDTILGMASHESKKQKLNTFLSKTNS